MKSLVQNIEDSIRACGGVPDQRTLSAIEASINDQASTSADLERAEVPYLVGLLREAGLRSSAKGVLDRAIGSASDPLERADLQNLQGRLSFEEHD